MGYIVYLDRNDDGIDLIPEGEKATTTADGHLQIAKGNTVLALYKAGTWKTVRFDKRVTRYVGKELFPISIESIESNADKSK